MSDIDFVASAFECIPETLARDFLFRHIHPFDPPGKSIMQLIDADTSLRIDVFRADGGITSRAISIFTVPIIAFSCVLPYWQQLRKNATSRAMFAGVNASVVGVLLAALYQPVWTSTVLRPADFVFASACFVALVIWKAPPWMIVIAAAALGAGSVFSGKIQRRSHDPSILARMGLRKRDQRIGLVDGGEAMPTEKLRLVGKTD